MNEVGSTEIGGNTKKIETNFKHCGRKENQLSFSPPLILISTIKSKNKLGKTYAAILNEELLPAFSETTQSPPKQDSLYLSQPAAI